MLELNLWVGSGYGQERASAVRHLTFFFCLVPRYNRYPVPKEHYL